MIREGAEPAASSGPGPQSVAEALRKLARESGVEVDPVVLEGALEHARRRHTGWGPVTVAAGRAIGLDVSIDDGPARERAGGAAHAGLVWDGGAWRAAELAAPAVGAARVSASPRTPLAAIGGDHVGPRDHGGHGESGPSLASRMGALFRVERDDVGVVAVYAVAIGVLSLVTPIAVQALVNTVAFGALLQPVAVLTALVFAALAFAAVLRALQFRVVEALQQRVFVRVATDLAHRVPRIKPEALEGAYGPELVNRFFEVVSVQKAAAGLLLDGLAVVLQILVGLVVLGFYHPALLAFDAALIAGLGTVLVALGRRGPETSIEESKAKYAVAAWLQEVARKRAFFATDAGASLAASRADALVRSYLNARRRHFGVLFRQVASLLGLQVLAAAALLGVGGWLVVQRQLTLGQLVAAELIVTSVVSGMLKLGKQLESVYDLAASVDKLGHLVDLPIEPEGTSVEAGRELFGARVRVFDADGGALVVSAEPGARVVHVESDERRRRAIAAALVGESENGAYRAEVDGCGSGLGSREFSRARARLLGPEPQVFVGTVEDNVRAGRDAVRDEDVYRALERAGLGARVRALPAGGRTQLGVDGWPLQRSELQLLMVARALTSGASLLVIDGAFDALGEDERSRALRALGEEPWTLVGLDAPDGHTARGLNAVATKGQGQ